MSDLRAIRDRMATLKDLHGVMGALKNLSIMESHKLTRLVETQQRSVSVILRAAADFLAFHPAYEIKTSEQEKRFYVLLGSEVGFCGDFNEAVVHAFHEHVEQTRPTVLGTVAIGLKLSAKLASHDREVRSLKGPTVAEEVAETLVALAAVLQEAEAASGGSWILTVVSHQPGETGSRVAVAQPFRDLRPAPAPPGSAPVLNLAPGVLWEELLEHYVFAALHHLFYSSLLAEHRRRHQHLEMAMSRLESASETARRKLNALRQEAITQEIEIILLSAEAVSSEEVRSEK